jgi:endonuclease III
MYPFHKQHKQTISFTLLSQKNMNNIDFDAPLSSTDDIDKIIYILQQRRKELSEQETIEAPPPEHHATQPTTAPPKPNKSPSKKLKDDDSEYRPSSDDDSPEAIQKHGPNEVIEVADDADEEEEEEEDGEYTDAEQDEEESADNDDGQEEASNKEEDNGEVQDDRRHYIRVREDSDDTDNDEEEEDDEEEEKEEEEHNSNNQQNNSDNINSALVAPPAPTVVAPTNPQTSSTSATVPPTTNPSIPVPEPPQPVATTNPQKKNVPVTKNVPPVPPSAIPPPANPPSPETDTPSADVPPIDTQEEDFSDLFAKSSRPPELRPAAIGDQTRPLVQGFISGSPKSSDIQSSLAVTTKTTTARRPIEEYTFRDFFKWKHVQLDNGLYCIVDPSNYVWNCSACNNEGSRKVHASYCPRNQNNNNRYAAWRRGVAISARDKSMSFCDPDPRLPDRLDYTAVKVVSSLREPRLKTLPTSVREIPSADPTSLTSTRLTRAKLRKLSKRTREELTFDPVDPDTPTSPPPLKKQRKLGTFLKSPPPSSKSPPPSLKSPPPSSTTDQAAPSGKKTSHHKPPERSPSKLSVKSAPISSNLFGKKSPLDDYPTKYRPALQQWYRSTSLITKIPRFMSRLENLVALAEAMGKEPSIGKQPRQIWTEGIRRDGNDNNTYALRLLFVLICSKRARDQSLAPLHLIVNDDKFSVQWIIDMGIPGLVELVKSVGFQNINARDIHLSALAIQTFYDGLVPDTVPELLRLSGVGTKIACLITQHAFDSIQGIAVDVHVRNWAIGMNWIPPEAEKSTEFTRAALEFWISPAVWGEVNTTLAALGQCIQNSSKVADLYDLASDKRFMDSRYAIQKLQATTYNSTSKSQGSTDFVAEEDDEWD